MFVGVDVGGTYTDGVLLEKEHIRATAKIPTRANLLESILETLDVLLEEGRKEELERIVISTTIITNLIAGHKYDEVALLLIPGPGLQQRHYDFKTKTMILAGAMDYRGRETQALQEKEIESALSELNTAGYSRVGVVGKFSPRNNKHEKQVAALIQERYPDWQVEMGFRAGPQLNFPRRIATTYLSCATREPYRHFVQSVFQALRERDIKAEVFILKADGGTMPLDKSIEQPVETIFSGPAASTLGALALTPPGQTEVVIDIGGTTTDIALILDGQPLLSSKGARVNSQLLQVHTLAVKSVAVGGDSLLEIEDGQLICHPQRQGPAYCMEGPAPTPTDALRTLGLISLGDRERAEAAMAQLAAPLGLSPLEMARRVVDLVVEKITREIERLFLEWEQEPAYRIWELLQEKKVRPALIAGVGGGAEGLIVQIAAKLGCRPLALPYAPVANAIGAAVAQPTLQISLRADTEEGYYHIREEGYRGPIAQGSFNEQKALDLAMEKLLEKAAQYGLKVTKEEIEVTYREVFNMIRGWSTTGRLYDFTVQTPRGITCRIAEGGK